MYTSTYLTALAFSAALFLPTISGNPSSLRLLKRNFDCDHHDEENLCTDAHTITPHNRDACIAIVNACLTDRIVRADPGRPEFYPCPPPDYHAPNCPGTGTGTGTDPVQSPPPVVTPPQNTTDTHQDSSVKEKKPEIQPKKMECMQTGTDGDKILLSCMPSS